MSKVNVNRVKAGDLELKEKVVAINRVVKTTRVVVHLVFLRWWWLEMKMVW